ATRADIAGQPGPGLSRGRLRAQRGRALRVLGALLDAEVRGQIGRADVAGTERRTIGIARAVARTHIARVGIRHEEEARARLPAAAVRHAVARAALGHRAAPIDRHARARLAG